MTGTSAKENFSPSEQNLSIEKQQDTANMETKNQLGKIAEDIVQSTTIMETQALERNVQNTQLQELLFPIETQLWEVKNLNDPQEFKQAIQLLIKWYKHISKHTSLWGRHKPFDGISYTKDANASLKYLNKQAKQRLKILKNYKNQLENGVLNTVPQEFVNEVSKMLKDAPNFKETIAKAATGTRGDENIRNADYSQKGIKQYNKHQEKYRKYQDKLNNQTLEAAIYKLDIDDKAALNKYLVAILEGDIDNPSLDQYFQEHKSDILYLCCLDESLKNKVLKHHKLAGIYRTDIHDKHWELVPLSKRSEFVGTPLCYPVATSEAYRNLTPHQLGGIRGTYRDLLAKITPKMNPGQRECWAQLGELAVLGVGIRQLGKWLFKKNEKGERSIFTKIATVAGIGVGAKFASEAWLGKSLSGTLKGILNGGKDWEEITSQFSSKDGEYTKNMIERPVNATYLFGDMTVGEVQTLLATDPKSDIYPWLKAKYTKSSPKNEEALMLLERMDKSDPTKELNQYLLAVVPTEKLSFAYRNKSVADLAEKYTNSIKGVGSYLKAHPELQLNDEKKDELLEVLKGSDNLTEQDADRLVKEKYFILPEEYITKFESQLQELSFSNNGELNTLRKQLHIIENNPEFSGIELDRKDLNTIQLKLKNKTVELNLSQKTIAGFQNSIGAEIPFSGVEELINTGVLLLKLQSHPVWKTADQSKNTDKNRPFDVNEGFGFQNIIFKKVDENGKSAEEAIINDIPFIGELDRKFPTIEKDQNRQFFVSYLNTLWKMDADYASHIPEDVQG